MNFSCIANGDQLCALFKNTLASKMHQGGGSTLLLFQMHIHKAASQSSINASNHPEDKCCEASDTQDICTRKAVYSRAIYEAFPYPLVKMFLVSIPLEQILDYLFSSSLNAAANFNHLMVEICWTPPLPFCLDSHIDTAGIIKDFIYQVKEHDVNM